MKPTTSWFTISCVVVGVAVPARAGEPPISTNARPLVITVAGISVLKTRDPEVVKRFGQGCYVAEEGHAGGRYFVNPERTLTLHTTIGVSSWIEAVELSGYASLPLSCIGIAETTSHRLKERLQTEHGIHLGMTPADLLRLLGPADGEESKSPSLTLIYRADQQADERLAYYEARYRFVAGKLVQFSVYNGC